MATSCEFKTSEAATKSWLRDRKIIDGFLNILDLNKFRITVTNFSNVAQNKYGITERLFSETEDGKKAIPNKEAFKAIDNAKGIYYQLSTPVKSGVSELFQNNPELSSIGTPQQYSAYLDTIFPNSKVKDVVYHGGPIQITNKFNESLTEDGLYKGIYFTDNQSYLKELNKIKPTSKVTSVIINAKDNYNMEEPIGYGVGQEWKLEQYDSISGKDSGQTSEGNIYAVRSPEQIYVLGSKQDVEGFKQFVKAPSAILQRDGAPQSIANNQTLAKVKEAITKMGVSLVTLADYAKVSDIQTKGINGLADLTRRIIAVSEGHEGVALTEEMVHVSFAILQQTNPQMVTEMISKIDRFKIYKTTFDQYKNDPRYQLENGKPNIRKIKIEAVGKLISEVIINKEQAIEQYPELREYENLSLIERFWNAIMDLFRGMYRKSDISIFEKAGAQVVEGVGTVDQITEDGVYLQKAADPVEDIFNTYKEINNSTSDPTNDEDGKRVYINDGTSYGSVTQKIKGGKTLDRTDFQKKIDDQMRLWGTEGHNYIQGFLQSLIDPITGLKRETPVAYAPITNLPNSVQKAIKDYIVELVI
jgi:hypothetical protein